MLKLLPQENPSNPVSKQKKRTRAEAQKVLKVTVHKFENSSKKIFDVAGRQLMEFIKKAENVTMAELNDLIHNLQRTVLGLQKKRLDAVRRKQRKPPPHNPTK